MSNISHTDIFNALNNFSSLFATEDDLEAALLVEEERTRRHVKLVFCIIYGILFVLGTIGNG